MVSRNGISTARRGRKAGFVALTLVGAGLASACSGSSVDEPNGEAGRSASAGSAAVGGNAGSAAGGKGGGGAAAGSGGSSGAAASGGSGAGRAGASGAGGGGQAGGGGKAGGAGSSSGAAGAGSGGRAGEAGSTASGGTGGDAGAGCVSVEGDQTAKQYAHRAVSSGFAGSDAEYSELYSLSCFSVDDCIAPCLERGGTEEMCAASQCIESIDDYCLPATTWSGLGALAAEGTDPYTDAAQLVLVNDPYLDHLLLDDFRFEVPVNAEIHGITVTVRRAGGGANEAVDAEVRLIKNGQKGGSDRSSPEPWSAPDFVDVEYGGPADLWGQSWTAADFNAQNFGVTLAARYPQTAGNGRGYIDIVYVTVHYRGCD